MVQRAGGDGGRRWPAVEVELIAPGAGRRGREIACQQALDQGVRLAEKRLALGPGRGGRLRDQALEILGLRPQAAPVDQRPSERIHLVDQESRAVEAQPEGVAEQRLAEPSDGMARRALVAPQQPGPFHHVAGVEALGPEGRRALPAGAEELREQARIRIDEAAAQEPEDFAGPRQVACLPGRVEQAEAGFEQMHVRVLAAGQLMPVVLVPTAVRGMHPLDDLHRLVDPRPVDRGAGLLREVAEGQEREGMVVEVAPVVENLALAIEPRHPSGAPIRRPSEAAQGIHHTHGEREAALAVRQAQPQRTGSGLAEQGQRLLEQPAGVGGPVQPEGQGGASHPGEVAV